MPPLTFVGGAYFSRSTNVNAQRCVNLYPELDPTGKSPVALYPTPGTILFATTGVSAPIRGLICWDDRVYLVCGTKFLEVDSAGTVTERGDLGSSVSTTARVSMEHNNTQLLLVDGSTKGFIYRPSVAALQQITTAGFSGGLLANYMDGYFILTTPDTQDIRISGLQNGFEWNPLDFATAEGAPDDIVASIVNHREFWAFGSESTEVFYNSGDATFPLERIQGAFIEVGCAAPYSVAKMDNSVFWLSQDHRGAGMVLRADGYTPSVVSTRALESTIATYGTISDAAAFCYQEFGHTFYVLTFPTARKTWTYDASTQLWHEREYQDVIQGPGRIRANNYCFAFGKHLVGDYETGRLLEMDSNTFTDDGQYIKRLRSCPHLHNDRKRLYYHKFELDMEFGVGLLSGQGVDPQAMLRWSDDGGHTWSNERWTSFGRRGEYFARAVWRRLGASRDRIFEVSVTDPVKVVIIEAHVEIGQGDI